MPHPDPTIAALLEENSALKKSIFELERLRCFSPEDTLKLGILDGSPFTIWACDRDFKIVLWNKKCEQTYGHTKDEALGKNFLELFVDAPERGAARNDCLEIIDHGIRCENCLAYDNHKRDGQRTMLTNCFRIWDERTNQYLQAEIGLHIDFDLSSEKRKHRQLREVGLEIVYRMNLQKDASKREFLARVKASAKDKELELLKRTIELDTWERESGVSLSKAHLLKLRKLIEEQRSSISRRVVTLERSISEMPGVEYLTQMEKEVSQFEDEKIEMPTSPGLSGPI